MFCIQDRLGGYLQLSVVALLVRAEADPAAWPPGEPGRRIPAFGRARGLMRAEQTQAAGWRLSCEVSGAGAA
jgi:hypothetical protein